MRQNIGFIGAGNISQSLISGLLNSKAVLPQNIFVSNRTAGKLQKVVSDFGITAVNNNEDVLAQCQTVIVGVKPQDLNETLEPLESIVEENHYLVSVAAGVTIEKLKKMLPHDQWLRMMPTIGARTGLSVSGLYTDSTDETFTSFIENLFNNVGSVVRCDDEEQFDSLMVAASSGIGFVIELMLYWQEWLEERGFTPDDAKAATAQTFFGAASLAINENSITLTDLINKVASKKGVTQAGLDSMRELETEKTLRLSFDKAVQRTQEILKSIP